MESGSYATSDGSFNDKYERHLFSGPEEIGVGFAVT